MQMQIPVGLIVLHLDINLFHVYK